MRDGTDEILEREKTSAQHLIHSTKILQSNMLFPDSLFTVKMISFRADNTFFSDTTIYDKQENEWVDYRILRCFYNHNNTTYLITILKPTLEENELMEGLLSSLCIVVSFLILSFLTVNWILSKWLWKSFYNTLTLVNEYELKKNKQLLLGHSNIKEFNELNEALLKMTNKIYTDFIRQKEFTENASHELQTPLAVIKSKLELLIQSENLKEDEMQQIQIIETAVNKLSSLNKTLLLLVKIENRQFKDELELSMLNTIEKILSNYKNLLLDKNIQLTEEYKNDFWVKINPQLLDILLSNLLQNAIRHNIKNGILKIKTDHHSLSISNTGEALKVSPVELFERFKKKSNSQESLGIGLAIVKSIADIYALEITYFYTNNEHTFKVTFKT